LEDVGTVKDKVHVSFTKSSFDLTVTDLKGKSYRLLKNNLEKDIVPEQSTFIVKKNKLVVKLRKIKGEYSFDQWTTLTNKKNKEEVEKTKKDPMGGALKRLSPSTCRSCFIFNRHYGHDEKHVRRRRREHEKGDWRSYAQESQRREALHSGNGRRLLRRLSF
jgi:hypothetical protein